MGCVGWGGGEGGGHEGRQRGREKNVRQGPSVGVRR